MTDKIHKMPTKRRRVGRTPIKKRASRGEQGRAELVREVEETQELSKIGSFDFDPISRHLRWSAQNHKIYGVDLDTPTEQLFEFYVSRIHPDDRAQHLETVSRALETGQGYTTDYRLVLPNDEVKHVHAVAKVEKDSLGRVRRLRGTCQDVTEHVQREEEVRFALDVLQIGIWKFNPVTQALAWDKSMYRVFDIEPGDFSGDYQAWESALTPEARAKAVEELGQALRGEKEFNTTFEIQTRTRGRRSIAGRGKVIRNSSGAPVMMYGINYDRTQEMELQNAVEAERLKSLHNAKLASLGEMSAGVAHEINNPLAIIDGTVSMLHKFTSDPSKFAAKIETIQKATTRIARIVGGLRKFSRSAEATVLSTHAVAAIVEEVVHMTMTRAKRHDTKLDASIKTSSLIVCDEIGIEQVLINLVNNSIDAAKETKDRWVRISAFDDKNVVVIQVRDSGPGIPKDIAAKLFQPFFTTKAVGEGTGLGLSIAKGILDDHKATITVLDREPNTCFEIRFPKGPT